MKIATILSSLVVFSSVATNSFAQPIPSQNPPANAGSSPASNAANVAKPAPDDIGFTWWNDIPEMIRLGNQKYQKDDYKEAENFYRGAQLKQPEQAAAAFNLGLTEAKEGNHGAAADDFKKALNLAGEDANLRGKALYNLGSTHLQQAIKTFTPDAKSTGQGNSSAPAISDDDRKSAIQSAVQSIEAFNGALKLNPKDEAAAFNKAQAQHLLEFAAKPPPPKKDDEKQNNQGDENKDQQQNKDPQQPNNKDDNQQSKPDQNDQPQKPQPKDPDDKKGDQQQPKPDQNDEEKKKQDAGQDKDKKDDSKQGDQQDEKKKEPAQQKPQDSKGGEGGSNEKPVEMSQEEANQMLNLLGDQQNIVLKKNRYPFNRPEPKKDW